MKGCKSGKSKRERTGFKHEKTHKIGAKVDTTELEKKKFMQSFVEEVQIHEEENERENYNKPKSENSRQPGCPEEKVKAIEEALRYFQMI